MPNSENGEQEWLRQADHTASRDFDKAVMTLAAGALGVSLAFVHDVEPHPTNTNDGSAQRHADLIGMCA